MWIDFCPVCKATLMPADTRSSQRCWNCGWTTTAGEDESQASAASNSALPADLRADIARDAWSRRPVPTREMVLSKVKQCFPDRVSDVMALLDTVGYWFHRHERIMPETLRAQTQLAALKLSGRNLTRLRDYVEEAKSDYRNVIAPAESPSLLRLGVIAYGRLSLEDLRRLLEDEASQYMTWLNNEDETSSASSTPT